MLWCLLCVAYIVYYTDSCIIMGALQTTQSTNQHDEVDAPNSLVPPSRLRGMAGSRKYLLSLDRNMKAFLRASNLPGLEYRLKLAGYRTFHDLLTTDRETLEASGFTAIMAQRLMNAVSEYIDRQLQRSEAERLPFRLVRRGQRIQTEPSESMKDNPNYQKRNVKRRKLVEDPWKRGLNISLSDAHHTPRQTHQRPSQVRLMSESDLQRQHLLSPPSHVLPAASSGSDDSGDEVPLENSSGVELPPDTEFPPEDEIRTELHPGDHSGAEHPPEDSSGIRLPPGTAGQKILGIMVSKPPPLEKPPSRHEPPFPDLDALSGDISLPEELPDSGGLEETDTPAGLAFGLHLPRSFSVPSDFKLTLEDAALENHYFTRIRTFSCPPSLTTTLPTTPSHSTSIDTLMNTLRSCRSVNNLYSTLYSLSQHTACPQDALEANEKGALEAVVDVLKKHCGVLRVAEVCCLLIRHLCRGTSESVCVPQDSLSAVCKALDAHSAAHRSFLIQALVTAAALCATGQDESHYEHFSIPCTSKNVYMIKSMNHNSLGCEHTYRPRCKNESHPMCRTRFCQY